MNEPQAPLHQESTKRRWQLGHLPTRLRGLRTTAVIALLAPIALLAAACGGPATPGVPTGATKTTTTAASTPAGSSTGASGPLAYASCMRSHGVSNFPDPSSSGGFPKQDVISAESSVSNSQVDAASNDCKALLPAGQSLSGKPVQTVTVQDQKDYLKTVACLRSHGITNFPDPVFSGGSVHFTIPPSINMHSAKFLEATQVCEKLIPAGLPGSGS